MFANLVQDASQSLLSQIDFKLLSFNLGSNQSVLIDVRDSFLIVIVSILESHDLDLTLVRFDHCELVSLSIQKLVSSFAELKNCQDYYNKLQNNCLDRQNDKLVTPAYRQQNYDISDKYKSIAEHKAEVCSESEQVEELRMSSKSGQS